MLTRYSPLTPYHFCVNIIYYIIILNYCLFTFANHLFAYQHEAAINLNELILLTTIPFLFAYANKHKISAI